MGQRENLMRNFNIFSQNENKITTCQKLCDIEKSVKRHIQH